MKSTYEFAAAQLVERIMALVPRHPEILAMKSCWDLFNVPGFNCSDIGPSMAQAAWALEECKRLAKINPHEKHH